MTTENRNYPNFSGLFTTREIYSNPPSDSTVVTPVSYGGGHFSRESVRTPGFFRLKKRRSKIDLPMNPFSFVSQKDSRGYGTLETTITGPTGDSYFSQQTGYWANEPVQLSPAFPNWLAASAVNKLLNKVKASSVNLGVAIGEGRQTFNMFADTATKLVNAVRAVKSGNIGAAASALGAVAPRRSGRTKKVANSWLELQYGWLPLLSDLHGAAEFLANTLYRTPRSRITSSAMVHESFSDPLVVSEPWLRSDAWSTQHTIRYVVYFQESIYGGNLPVALGLTNPLAIAWELVPFSFVVDWFLPIGKFFDNLDATIGKEFVKGCKTEFFRGVSTRNLLAYSPPPSGGTTISRHGRILGTNTFISCARSPLTGWPTVPIPRFKSPFSVGHGLNASALIIQRLRNVFR